MTDAIVLAAGMGRRLAGATDGPKWLAPVGGSCPAEVQLGAFEAAGIRRIMVVTSPSPSAIAAAVEPWLDRLDIELVQNEHAHDRNNWYSLHLGLDRWLATGGDEVVLVNSDLYAGVDWFIDLMASVKGRPVPRRWRSTRHEAATTRR